MRAVLGTLSGGALNAALCTPVEQRRHGSPLQSIIAGGMAASSTRNQSGVGESEEDELSPVRQPMSPGATARVRKGGAATA